MQEEKCIPEKLFFGGAGGRKPRLYECARLHQTGNRRKISCRAGFIRAAGRILWRASMRLRRAVCASPRSGGRARRGRSGEIRPIPRTACSLSVACGDSAPGGSARGLSHGMRNGAYRCRCALSLSLQPLIQCARWEARKSSVGAACVRSAKPPRRGAQKRLPPRPRGLPAHDGALPRPRAESARRVWAAFPGLCQRKETGWLFRR